MIFVTVGTQLSFDRLVEAVDLWAGSNLSEKIFAQVGPAKYKPVNFDSKEFINPDEADSLFQKSDLIISHAGMGSILTALKYRKPILIMPRKAGLGEHRNDHQLATAKWLGVKPGISVAWEVEDVQSILNMRTSLRGGDGISEFASPELISSLKSLIHS